MINFLMNIPQIAGLLRVLYYKYKLRVKWQPSYDLKRNLYGVKIDNIQMWFAEPPFFDIEHALLDYLAALPINKSKVYVDAGSYIGTFAIYCASIAKENLVIACEPDEVNRGALLKNLELNKLSNVLVVEKALWDSETLLTFNSQQGEMSGVEFSDINKDTHKVATTTLDLIRSNLGKKIDYIKMDIEGAELEAIAGAHKLISLDRPKFVIASYHIRDGNRTAERVENLLKTLGYKVQTREGKQTVTIGE